MQLHTPTQCTHPLSAHAHSVHTHTQCTRPLSAHAHSVYTPTQCTRPLSTPTHSQCSRCTLAPASPLVWASCRRCGRRRRGDDACRSVWVGAQSLSHHRTQVSYNIDHTYNPINTVTTGCIRLHNMLYNTNTRLPPACHMHRQHTNIG